MIRRRGDRGSAGVWLLGLCSVLVLAATAAVLVGSAMVTRHKAIAAADLSALAAAGKAWEGTESACAAAADIATSMGAQLTSCSLSGVIAEVSVAVSVELGVVGLATAEASARAGPVESVAQRLSR
ncbi:MAG: Rv3654c family TadE-like protein [Geodermatophilaceae bacterium]|jgi:secretion/DNA translocation related TadE-like protein